MGPGEGCQRQLTRAAAGTARTTDPASHLQPSGVPTSLDDLRAGRPILECEPGGTGAGPI